MMAEQGKKLDETTRKQPLTYFVAAVGANAIKIGFSTDFEQRLEDLKTGTPFELMPIAFIYGPENVEHAAHFRLKEYRIRGEWFEDVQEVWDYIEIHAHWILGRDEALSFVTLSKKHESIAYHDESAHRGLVIAGIRDAFNRSPLDSRQRQIISLRFGLDPTIPAMTLAQVGEAMGISLERARQIERESLLRLAKCKRMFSVYG